jgi:hypothetical protein
MSNNNLWWSFDADNNSFSALPAGPMLLPALGVFAVVAAVQSIRGALTPRPNHPGASFMASDAYRLMKERQDFLIAKRVQGIMGEGEGLTIGEHTELAKLQRPSWANGDTWSF